MVPTSSRLLMQRQSVDPRPPVDDHGPSTPGDLYPGMVSTTGRHGMMKTLRTGGLLALALAFAGVAAAQYGDIDDLKVAKPEDKVDVKIVPRRPKGAIVLFDGKDLDKWVGVDGKPARLEARRRRAMQVDGGGIMTKEKFDGHFKLHVEFRVPYMPDAKGQGRGNSGVYLQGRYEVQVLDSYGLEQQGQRLRRHLSGRRPARSTPARPRPSGRATTSTSTPRSSRTARRTSRPGSASSRTASKIHEDVQDPGGQHRRRPRRRPEPARPDPPAGPRQPGAVSQHLAPAGEVK